MLSFNPAANSMTQIASQITRVVSGGQTGVDRAALDVAISCGLPHGGWCPKGRLAEDGPIPATYQLDETDSRDYAVRTEQNVIESDGTLILFVQKMTGGTKLTWNLARKHRRPRLSVDLDTPELSVAAEQTRAWISQENIRVITVAGPRESTLPGIGVRAEAFLQCLFDANSEG